MVRPAVANRRCRINKGQLKGMVIQVISEIDEIINGEGESAVGQQRLRRCRMKLVQLAKHLRVSKPGEVISGAEILLVMSQAVHLVYRWVKKD